MPITTASRVCGWCETSIEGFHHNARYCSKAHQVKANDYRQAEAKKAALREERGWADEHFVRPCAQCGGSMAGKRPHAVYCSRACKNLASHVRLLSDEETHARIRQKDRERYRQDPQRYKDYANARQRRFKEHPDYRPFPESEWLKLVRRYGGRCAYCGGEGKIEQDHVVPISRGGRHAIANVLPACFNCNRAKGSKLVSEWRYGPKGGVRA